MRSWVRALAVVALVGVSVSSRPAMAQPGGWRRVGDLSAARVGPAMAALPGGSALVAGGSGLPTAELYDPARGRFVPTGSMSVGRSFATATLLRDGTVLVAGGSGPGGALNSAEVYDPSTGRFTLLESRMSSPRERHTATLLPSGDVLLVGGFNARSGTVATAEIYDARARAFRVTGSLSLSRSHHAATYLPGDSASPAGYVLVVGGVRSVGGQMVEQSTAELYALSTSSFSPAGLMSADRDRPTVTYLPALGRAIVIGGRSSSGRGGTRGAETVELYDLRTRSFTQGPELNVGRAGHQTLTLPDGRLLVIGGYSDAQGRPVETAELYSPGGTFVTDGSLSQARQDMGAVRLSTGQVLVAGGRGGGSTPLRSAELYSP